MKRNQTLKLCLGLALLPVAGFAQATPVTMESYAAHAGMRELTFSATGVSNKELNDSFGGLTISLGQYATPTLQFALRQSVNYSNPPGAAGGSNWNGSTRLALDQHFAREATVRPFLGVNFGGIYGANVRDSIAAGIEGGAKFYVRPRAFVFLLAEYAWTFRHSSAVNDRFDDGQFNWNAGVGLNF